MPRMSDTTRKILTKIDEMTDWIKDIDKQQCELTVDRERAIERIKEYRELLAVPKPAKKKAGPKAKESKPCHQCPDCGDINDGGICPKCGKERK